MKKAIAALLFLAFSASIGHSAHAQTDPAADASLVTADTELGTIDTELGTANTTLGTIATNTEATTVALTGVNVQSGTTASVDGADVANATTDLGQITPSLQGSTSTSTDATIVLQMQNDDSKLDETQGLTLGNPSEQQAKRQLQVNANLQGMAIGHFKSTIGTLDKAATVLEGKLDAALSEKAATSVNGAIGVVGVRATEILTEQVELNTIAVTQAEFNRLDRQERVVDDHRQAMIELATATP